jgi:hypothetical protein
MLSQTLKLFIAYLPQAIKQVLPIIIVQFAED